MTKFLLSLVLLALAVSPAATASICDAHYPLDGSLADATGNGYDGMMIAKDGAPERPQFADGKYGMALHITENTAMRSFLDLHHETCPQFTITAWFRLSSAGDGAPQGILSTGARGGIPAVVAQGSTLMLYGSGNGLWQQDAVRDGTTWYFVAATFDYASRTYKLYWRNRAQEGTLSETPYEAEDAFWVGARSDNFRYPAKDLYVDDVRVYGRVLDLNEIRDASANAVAHGTVQGPTIIAPITDGSPTVMDRIGSGPSINVPEDTVGRRPPFGDDPILDVDSSGEPDD